MTELEREIYEWDKLKYYYYLTGIPKSPELDNEVYYEAYYSTKRYNLVWGGRGSGKSYDIEGKMPIVDIVTRPFCRYLMIRQVYGSVEGSQYQELLDYISKWGIRHLFNITRRPLKITCKANGNYIIFAGMDKPESLKSIKDVTDAIFGEACHIKSEEGVDKVDKAIRTPLIDNTRLFFVFNPDNKAHFLYKWFFDPDTEQQYSFYRQDMLSINTTYKDNKFISYNFKRLIEKDRVANPDRFKVDGLGKWGELKKLNAYYPNFKSEIHVFDGLKQSVYDRNLPIHIAFDFNVFPYITLRINQVIPNANKQILRVCHIDEICLNEKQHGADKVGRINETIKEFLRRYNKHNGKVFVYGDRSGHNKKTNAVSDYSTVFMMLRPTPANKWSRGVDPYPEYKALGCRFEVIDLTEKSQNPRHAVRKVFFRRIQAGVQGVLPLDRRLGTINAAGRKRQLSVNYGGWQIIQAIDSDCKFLINDYINVEEDAVNGTKDERNKKLTHASDAEDYFYCKYFESEYKEIEAELSR